ncbi:FitA-like ribbon-helix-helix domain-containing protein [Frondihabitans cladoniiphilus]|uniref:Antitoxin FitA-like ribbon-helix-helix domain-containing protein n=1 Tax=Frondihabitans cladoniiphilus TaxID=715785 RepID=A0ABP8VYQ4_9MICO
MAVITVRNLDDEVQRRIKVRAAAHHHSMEAEARAILSAAVSGGDFGRAWVREFRESPDVDLVLPERSTPRRLDFE